MGHSITELKNLEACEGMNNAILEAIASRNGELPTLLGTDGKGTSLFVFESDNTEVIHAGDYVATEEDEGFAETRAQILSNR